MSDEATSSSESRHQHARETGAPPPILHIVALLPELETVASCLQTAVAAARGAPSVISAVHVGFDPDHTFVSAEEQDIQQLRDLYEGKPEVRLAHINAAFCSFMATLSDGPTIRWKNDEGDIDANIVDEARRADLIVIGRPVHLDAADALHCALFHVRRPVLVAPRQAHNEARTIGRHIIVGWKPGSPVQNAIAAAMPWLRRAEKVTVLWGAKAGAEPYDHSAREFFGTLGIAAEIIGLQPNRESVGGRLVSEASRLGGDCLLIGALRHGALWDAILGGVTREVLSNADIPVFMMR